MFFMQLCLTMALSCQVYIQREWPTEEICRRELFQRMNRTSDPWVGHGYCGTELISQERLMADIWADIWADQGTDSKPLENQ